MAESLAAPQPARRGMRWAQTGVMAATALLAACSTVVPRGNQPAPPPPPLAGPVKQSGPLPEEARDRVAVLVPLTGPNAAVGQSIANAANMALLDTGGNRLRITAYDTSLGAAAATQKAIAEGNGLILGPLLADDVRQVAPIAAQAHVPVLSFSNDIDVAGHGVYLLGFLPTASIERVIDYAQERGLTRFAALVPNGLYGRRASNAVLRAAQEASATVVSMQGYDRSPASLTAAISSAS